MLETSAVIVCEENTYPEDHCTLNDATNWEGRLIECPLNVALAGHIGCQEVDARSKGLDLLDNRTGLLVCVPTSGDDGEVLRAALGEIDGERTAETAEAAYDEISGIVAEVESLRGAPDLLQISVSFCAMSFLLLDGWQPTGTEIFGSGPSEMTTLPMCLPARR